MEPAQSILNDGALLRRYASEGDPSAFAELVGRYAAMVYSTARRVTGRGDIAEDVSQDCFLRMAERSASITGSVGAWLHRTALHRSLELLRSERSRMQREARVAEAKVAESAPADGSAPGDSSRLIAQVDAALAALPQDLRVLLVEHYLCGRSQSELAAQMKLNQSTVSRRIDKGLARLRQRLESAGATTPLVLIGELFSTPGQSPPPPSLTASLMKIGISGVGRVPAAPLITKFAAAFAAIVAGGLIFLAAVSYFGTPRGPTLRSVPGSLAAGGGPAATSATGDKKDENEANEMELEAVQPEIPTADIPAAMRYYQQALGFKLKSGDGTGYTILERDDVQLALLPKSAQFNGPTSLYIFVRKLDAYFAIAKANGARIVRPPAEGAYGMRDFAVLDPEGNRISFGEAVKKKH